MKYLDNIVINEEIIFIFLLSECSIPFSTDTLSYEFRYIVRSVLVINIYCHKNNSNIEVYRNESSISCNEYHWYKMQTMGEYLYVSHDKFNLSCGNDKFRKHGESFIVIFLI